MRFGRLRFGSIEIDGVTHPHDVVIDRSGVRKRKKSPLKNTVKSLGIPHYRSVDEKVPWKCHRLVIGTGNYESLPVMDDVKLEARRRNVELLILPYA